MHDDEIPAPDGFHRPKHDRDYLRQVVLDGYALRTWETGRRANTGQELLGYEFCAPDGAVLFTGEDFGCSPMDPIDSDRALRALLGFLTLKPGDTDPDYFDGYTEAQLEFARGDAEQLQFWCDDEDPAAFVDLDERTPNDEQ